MDALFDCLATLTDRPLGTVVHIGAGNGLVLERYARLAPARVVLVEGDADIAAELQRRAAAYPWAEVHARPVAASAGPLPWHRYNLPTLNGPLHAAALSAYYPRLRLVESRTVDALALPELLAGLTLGGLEPGSEHERIHVLVLDVPGQEDALLAALPQEQLIAFGAVLLRGCREALQPGGAAAEKAVSLLRGRCYQTVSANSEQEPLWPVALLRFDPARYQTEQLQQRVAALQTALQHSEKTAAERAAQVEQLTKARDEQARLAAERAAQLQTMTQAKAELDKATQERQAQIEALGQAKAAAEKTAADRAAQVAQLTQARDEQARLAAERAAQLQTMTQAKGELDKATQERQAQIQALGQAKAAAEKLAAERQMQVEQAAAAKAAAEKTAAERAAQIAQLTQARDEQTSLATERQVQLETLTAAKAELEKTSQARKTQLDALNARATKLESERDALAVEKKAITAARDEQTKLVRDARQQSAKLDAELADIGARFRLLQEELIKSEAQIELIADLLLREPRT